MSELHLDNSENKDQSTKTSKINENYIERWYNYPYKTAQISENNEKSNNTNTKYLFTTDASGRYYYLTQNYDKSTKNQTTFIGSCTSLHKNGVPQYIPNFPFNLDDINFNICQDF